MTTDDPKTNPADDGWNLVNTGLESPKWVKDRIHIEYVGENRFLLTSFETDVVYHYESKYFNSLGEAKAEGDYWLKHGERPSSPNPPKQTVSPPPDTSEVDELIHNMKTDPPYHPFLAFRIREAITYLLERERSRIVQGG